MKQYIVTVKHDNGTTRIRTAATDEAAVKEIIMKAEGCPERAIIRIREARYYKKDKR